MENWILNTICLCLCSWSPRMTVHLEAGGYFRDSTTFSIYFILYHNWMSETATKMAYSEMILHSPSHIRIFVEEWCHISCLNNLYACCFYSLLIRDRIPLFDNCNWWYNYNPRTGWSQWKRSFYTFPFFSGKVYKDWAGGCQSHQSHAQTYQRKCQICANPWPVFTIDCDCREEFPIAL